MGFKHIALQAAMADLLSGDTFHRALHTGMCFVFVNKQTQHTSHDYNGEDNRKLLEVCKQILQWRWLIRDEIGMASARLLADVDVKLRSLVLSSSMHKTDQRGLIRPSGGLGVIFSGDM